MMMKKRTGLFVIEEQQQQCAPTAHYFKPPSRWETVRNGMVEGMQGKIYNGTTKISEMLLQAGNTVEDLTRKALGRFAPAKLKARVDADPNSKSTNRAHIESAVRYNIAKRLDHRLWRIEEQESEQQYV